MSEKSEANDSDPSIAKARGTTNAARHVAALGLSKSADGLIDPKLVLSWLLTSLGAPAWMIGLLVPIRESGALLPQLFTAGFLLQQPRRKWVWAIGAVVQGISALVIALAGFVLQGRMAGFVVLAALSVLAIARSVCSVSYKDVLGRTVEKGRRGQVTGLAGSVSASVVILYALTLSAGVVARMELVLAGLTIAGFAWLAGGAIMTGMQEEATRAETPLPLAKNLGRQLATLRADRALQNFILTRALLTGTALAPPYMVAAASTGGGSAYQGLGFLVLASSGAALVSSFVWGRLSDHSSRKVLIFSAIVAMCALFATVMLSQLHVLSLPFVLPLLLFVHMIAYQGVRLGRSTHLVDMGTTDNRADYTAISNTVIGIILIFGGIFAVVAEYFGVKWVLILMAAMCAAAIPAGLNLEEVQSDAAKNAP